MSSVQTSESRRFEIQEANTEHPEQGNPSSPSRKRWLFLIGCILPTFVFLISLIYLEKPWYQFVPKRFGTVVPGKIYRSGQISGSLIEEVILKYDIGRIICLSGRDYNNSHQVAERNAAGKHKVHYDQFALAGDGTGSIIQYASAIRILRISEQRGTPVLIHCEAGSSRTGVAVAYYRLFIQKEDPRVIYDELLEYGFDSSPDNPSIQYLNDNMESMARYLVEWNVIDELPESFPRIGPETSASSQGNPINL